MIACAPHPETKRARPIDRPRRLSQRPAAPIEFVPHPLFALPGAAARVEALNPGTIPVPFHAPPVRSRLLADCGLLLPDVPLLDREEERYLFCRMNFLKCTAGRLLERSGRNGGLPVDVQDRLHEALRVRNHIVSANQRLAIAAARPFVTPSLPLAELVSETALPLIRAVELFDCSRGLRFSTYATNAIRNRLGRIRLQIARRAKREPQVLPAVLESVVDDGEPPRSSRAVYVRRRRLVRTLLARLDDRERRVLAARFGLHDDRPAHSFRQIGQTLGLSKERTRQIAHAALEKLRAVVYDQ